MFDFNYRRLEEIQDGNTTIKYAYNQDGIRTSKQVGEDEYTYYFVSGSKILQEKRTDEEPITYEYDALGNVSGFAWYSKRYIYVKNATNDIIGILDEDSELVASYSYDGWGNCVVSNYTSSNIGNINSFRYRSYYYDSETGYYYLNSRYYDPVVGRFLNADDIDYLGESGNLLSYNLYSYCENNPVNMVDQSGETPANIIGAVCFGVLGAIGGVVLGQYLANRFGIKGKLARNMFIASVAALATASFAAIGYFLGPYIKNSWNSVKNGLVNLLNKSYKSIAPIDKTKMASKINVPKHAWDRVLKNPNSSNITELIRKAIKYGKWEVGNNGSVYINYYVGKEKVRMSGKIINGIFRISDAWVVTK